MFMRQLIRALLTCLVTLQVSGNDHSDESTIDLSLIDQAPQLSRYLTTSQRIELLKIEEAILAAKKTVRSGKFMRDRKPSTLNPNEDVKAINARGERLIQAAENEIIEKRIELTQLLRKAEQRRNQEAQERAVHYAASLDQLEFSAAAEFTLNKVLVDAWAAGYDALLFDRIFSVQDGTSTAASTEIQNQIYKTLVSLDGTRFTIQKASNLRLSISTKGRPSFTFDQQAPTSDSKAALLAIEQVRQTDSDKELLAVRAFDLETFKLISSQLVETTLNPSHSSNEAISTAVTKVELNDTENLLHTLEALEEPYTFSWNLSSTDDSVLIQRLILQQLIQEHTTIQLLETDFIWRTYMPNLALPERPSTATARFNLTHDYSDASIASYILSADATQQNRRVTIGTVTFNQTSTN